MVTVIKVIGETNDDKLVVEVIKDEITLTMSIPRDFTLEDISQEFELTLLQMEKDQ